MPRLCKGSHHSPSSLVPRRHDQQPGEQNLRAHNIQNISHIVDHRRLNRLGQASVAELTATRIDNETAFLASLTKGAQTPPSFFISHPRPARPTHPDTALFRHSTSINPAVANWHRAPLSAQAGRRRTASSHEFRQGEADVRRRSR